jgi:transposase
MVVVDGKGIPLGIFLSSASPAEVTLVPETLKTVAVPRRRGRPRSKLIRLIGDKAYDSDPLRGELAAQDIELISPHRRNRKRARTQDGRPLRRYKRRWIVERTIAWFGSFRRLVVRYERDPELHLAFFYFAAALITLRGL